MIFDVWNGYQRLGKDNQNQVIFQEWFLKLVLDNFNFLDDSSIERVVNQLIVQRLEDVVIMVIMDVCVYGGGGCLCE